MGVLITHNDHLTTHFNCLFCLTTGILYDCLSFLFKQLSSLGSSSLHRSRRWVLVENPSLSLQPTQGFVGSLSSAGKPLGCFFHVDGSAELKVKATEQLRGSGWAIWLVDRFDKEIKVEEDVHRFGLLIFFCT